MTKAWNDVSHRLIKIIHAKLNSIRAVTHIDYELSLETRIFRNAYCDEVLSIQAGGWIHQRYEYRDTGILPIAILRAIPYRRRMMFRLIFFRDCETSQRTQSISELTGIPIIIKELENNMKKLIPIVALSFLSATLAGTSCAADVQEKQQELLEKQLEVKEKQKELKQERREESAERVQASNQSMQQVSRASKIIGTNVKNPNGDKLGDIKELVLDPESGQVVYVVVSFGGILGVGDKLFALPWKALHWTRDKEYYVLDVDKSTLKKAPGFDKKHWPDSSKWDQLREEVNEFYQVNP